MVVSSRPQKPEAKINSGEMFVGLVWLVSSVVIIPTGLWRDAGRLMGSTGRPFGPHACPRGAF